MGSITSISPGHSDFGSAGSSPIRRSELGLIQPYEVVGYLKGYDSSQENRLMRLCDLVSLQFCAEARQNFKQVQYTEYPVVKDGVIRLKHNPVYWINSIYGYPNYTSVNYVRQGSVVRIQGQPDGTKMRVDYTVGAYSQPPDVVKAQLVDEVIRLWNINPKAASGATQSTTTAGPYTSSETYATWAVGGQALLSPAAVKLAHQFRPVRVPRCWQLMPPC